MAENKLVVINAALRALGETEVENVQQSDAASSLDDAWDDARRELLSDYYWPFAVKRATLVAASPVLTTEEALEWDYAYDLPNDWLRTNELSHSGDFRHGLIADWAFENNRILCDHTPVYIRYVFDNEELTSWDAKFDAAMAYQLALTSNLQITNSRALTADLDTLLTGKRYAARAKNARDQQPRQRPEGTWNKSRRGSRKLQGGWGQF